MENKNTPIEQQLINVTLAVNPPRKNDVIKGRGNGPNLHSGNVAFRKLVSARKDDYRKSSEFNKRQIVRQIIDLVHNSNPPGRFLTAEDRGIWKLMEYRSILRKVAQALRDKDHIREKETDTEPAIDGNDMEHLNMNGTTPPTSNTTSNPSGKILNLGGSVKRVREATNEYCETTVHRVPTSGREDFSLQSAQTIPSLGGEVPLQTSPTVHKLPRLGGDDGVHKSTNDSDMIIEIQKEIAMIREQVHQLSKRVTSVEERNNSIGSNAPRAYHNHNRSIGFSVDR